MHFSASTFMVFYLKQFSEVGQIKNSGTGPFNGAIWDDQHQSIVKSTIFHAQLALKRI